MVDQVSIINGALGLVGGEAVANIPTDINSADVPSRTRWAVRLYATTYESTLSLWPWNDARRRRLAGKHGEAPAFGYAAQYALEPDELKVCAVRSCGRSWKREGRFILHDGGDTLPIMTIRRVAAEELNAVTAELVSARLAYRIASSITEMGVTRKQELKAHATEQLREALLTDNWEGSAEELMGSGWWLAAQTSYQPELESIGIGTGRAGWLEQS